MELTSEQIAKVRQDVDSAIWFSRSHFRTATEDLLDTLDAREERIKELEEALVFYADKYNYDIAIWGIETPVDVDGGQRARKALGEKA